MAVPQPTLEEWLAFQKPIKMKGFVEFSDCDAELYEKKGIFFRAEWEKVGPYPAGRPVGFAGHANDIPHGRRRTYQYIHNCVETMRGYAGKEQFNAFRRKVIAQVRFPDGNWIKIETHFDGSKTFFFKENDLLRSWEPGIPRSFFHEE